ncbi:MAG: ABC transporter ATP-binding protein [Pseudomonadales bacterium]|nr:ABC transporter ATP-binding protein [Pseudomonadales bacterium]
MIKVDAISKTYRVWTSPLSRLLVSLAHRCLRPLTPDIYEGIYSRHCTEIEALGDVSFHLEQGDSLGIIGLNGSGKSTLLQIVAGTLQATSGRVDVNGRVAALLELGSGFDPEFTGRENVYLNAAILGLDAAQIEACYEDIVRFADIGDSIDRQVKTYSSGMLIRLAFAVQVHVDPDILIVDEALAVGDARFQAKALNKLEEILSRGTTLLFVGHDLNTVRSFCHRAILLHGGRMLSDGLPDEVIADYLKLVQSQQLEDTSNVESKSVTNGFSVDNYMVNRAEIDGYGDHAELSYDSAIDIRLNLSLGNSAAAPFLILDIIDQKGLQLSGKRIPIPCEQHETDKISIRINLRCCFQQGLYRFRFRIVDAPSIDQTRLLSRQDDLISLNMVEDMREKFTGLFPVPISFEWSESL